VCSMIEQHVLTKKECEALIPGDKLIIVDLTGYTNGHAVSYREGDICTFGFINSDYSNHKQVTIYIDRLPDQECIYIYSYRLARFSRDWWDVWLPH